MKSNGGSKGRKWQLQEGWDAVAQVGTATVAVGEGGGFDATRVEQTSVCSLCDAYETNLCRQNGRFYLHTRKAMGASLVDVRHVDCTCKPITEAAGRLLIAVFGARKGSICGKVLELDRADGVAR